MFDGSTAGDTDYVAIFATIPSKWSYGYSTQLQAKSSMGIKNSQDSESHYKFFNFVTTKVFKTLTDIFIGTFVDENCGTNFALLWKYDLRFVNAIVINLLWRCKTI